MFCAEKLDIPLPSATTDVTAILLSLIAAAYPPVAHAPNALMNPCMIMLPTDMNACCKILGIATTEISFRILKSTFLIFSSPSCGSFLSLTNINARARIALTP